MCSPDTARERSWPCRRTTGGTGNLQGSSACPSARWSARVPCSRWRAARACTAEPEECFEGEGFATNSSILDGLPTADAKETILAELEKRGLGHARVQYKLRDWLFSRQRYWGEPFPVIWEGGRHRALNESELRAGPARFGGFPPHGNARATPEQSHRLGALLGDRTARGQHHAAMGGLVLVLSPLLRSRQRLAVCRKRSRALLDGRRQARRSGSYVGGTEHAVLHLLYARFWHKILFDLGHLSSTRAVPASRQPGTHPRRGRTQDVEVARQRGEPRRRDQSVRGGCLPLLRNVHGPARTNETLEHDRRGGHCPFPRPGLAVGNGGTTGRLM